jgi:hypothetical protein
MLQLSHHNDWHCILNQGVLKPTTMGTIRTAAAQLITTGQVRL